MTRIRRSLRFLSYLLWPALVLLFTAAVVCAFQEVREPGVGLFLVAAGMTVLLLALERVLPARPDWRVASDPQLVNDLTHATFGSQAGALLGDSTLLMGATALAARASETLGGTLWPAAWPLPVQIALVILVADGLEYWRHRALHRVAWLWPLHALHHSVDRLHVLKAGRNHFLDMLTRTVSVFAPLVALGVPREVLIWYPAAILVLGPLAHANVAFRFPALVHRVLVTPPQHRVHHSAVLAESDRNFAPVLPLWDIVFGTFGDPGAIAVGTVGIEDDDVPPGLLGQVAAPFVRRGFVPPVRARV